MVFTAGKGLAEVSGGVACDAGEVLAAPAKAVLLAVITLSSTGLRPVWKMIPGADYYRLYRNGVQQGGNRTDWTMDDTPLASNTVYIYTVQAFNEAGPGPLSDPFTGKTLAASMEPADPFKESMEADLQDAFFNVEEFADNVIIVHAYDLESYEVPAIFDNEFESVDPDTHVPIIATQPKIQIRAADLHQVLQPADTVTIRGILYKLVTNEPDGVGTIRLLLHKKV